MRRVAGTFILLLVGAAVMLAVAMFTMMSAPERASDWLAFAFALAVAAAILYALMRIGLRLLRPEHVAAALEARPHRRPPVRPVAPEDLAGVPEPVTACPDCGFLGIRMLTLQDGVALGGGEIGDKMNCPRCGYQGLAIRFERREDYGAFLRELAPAHP